MLHLRKKFGAYLDLDDHDSIKEALFALLQQESEKAKSIIIDNLLPEGLKDSDDPKFEPDKKLNRAAKELRK